MRGFALNMPYIGLCYEGKLDNAIIVGNFTGVKMTIIYGRDLRGSDDPHTHLWI